MSREVRRESEADEFADDFSHYKPNTALVPVIQCQVGYVGSLVSGDLHHLYWVVSSVVLDYLHHL